MPNYAPGQILLGKYRIERLLGSGGFGEVYLATHVHLNAPRAIKVLNRSDDGVGSTAFTRFRERFELEARLGASLEHPNVVRVYDLDTAGDELVLAMEYAPGGSLLDRLESGVARQPVADVIALLRDVGRGLSVLHANGVVHRDIKPSNILFEAGGQAKIADLGIAQTPSGGMTQRSEVDEQTPRHPATPAFMSPEQESSRAYLTSASDIYSLGVVAFLVLTGQNPKGLPTGTRMGQFRPDVPAWLEDLVMRMLARGPEWRPQAAELVHILESITPQNMQPSVSAAAGGRLPPTLADEATGLSPVQRSERATPAGSPQPPAWQALLRRWWPAGAAALALMVIVLLAAGQPPSSPATALPPVRTLTRTAAGDSSGILPKEPTRTYTVTVTGTRQPTTPPPPTFTPTGTRTLTRTATRTQTAASPAAPGSGGRGLIAFTTGLDGRSQIQFYDPVTKAFSTLKGQHANSSVPSFSWDGRTIFYNATAGGSDYQVFSIPAAGGTPTQLTREGDNGAAVLSPDGRTIAYARTIAEKDKDLSLMDASGRSMRKVFNDIYWDDDPQWCPDGWLVFESSRDDHKCPGCTGIFIMNPAASSTLFHVTRNTVTAEEYTPACSPDGTKIAFEGRMNGEVITHIWLVNRDGSGAVRLTSGLHEERPAFSPDGKELAYTQREVGGAETIYILALDGSHPPLRVGLGRDAAWSRPPPGSP